MTRLPDALPTPHRPAAVPPRAPRGRGAALARRSARSVAPAGAPPSVLGAAWNALRTALLYAAPAAVLAGLLTAVDAQAQTTADLQQTLMAAARVEQPGFAGFSAARGQALFAQDFGGRFRCTTCHTADPRQAGQHAVTGKSITPLAPSANPARLTDPAKVDKWFRRNCRDVLGRTCTAVEQGDVVAWLASLR